MRVFILITILAVGNVLTLVLTMNNKTEIGRTESIQSVNESNTVYGAYEKVVYYAKPDLKSNITVF
jgi:hypothetical protein